MNKKRVYSYFRNVLIGLDQFTNTIFGGYPDETISATAYRKSQLEGHYLFKALQFVLDVIFSFHTRDHCFKAYISEVKRSQLPQSYREDQKCRQG